MITSDFVETDLHDFRDHFGLRRLTIKEAPYLESFSGIAELPELEVLIVQGARKLRDISDVSGLAASLRELELEGCTSLDTIDDVAPLVNLRFLGVSQSGKIESLAPIETLERLETLYAWGTTRIVDGDLSPLTRLPRLKEVRMMDRAPYTPRFRDLPTGAR